MWWDKENRVPSRVHKEKRVKLWRVCVPVLLVVLMLYNPFVALVSHHADGLSYQGLARHRATVGASEMQHYSPVEAEQALPEVEAVRVGFIVVEDESSAAPSLEDETLPQRPELTTSVWFRPPPAA